MTQEVTNVEKIRRLPWGITTDTANMAFFQLTFAGSLFVLFLLGNCAGVEQAVRSLLLSDQQAGAHVVVDLAALGVASR